MPEKEFTWIYIRWLYLEYPGTSLIQVAIFKIGHRFLFFFLLTLFIYFERDRERKKENMNRGGTEKGRERIPTRLCAPSTEPDVGLEPTNYEIMAWAEIKSRTLNQLSAHKIRHHFKNRERILKKKKEKMVKFGRILSLSSFIKCNSQMMFQISRIPTH